MKFDGQEIDAFRGTIPMSRFDLEFPHLSDEVIRLVITVQVDEVTHKIDKRTGAHIREHKLRIKDVEYG